MNPFEMVIGIVLIVMIGRVLQARYRAHHGIVADEHGNEQRLDSGETARLRDEMRNLKERIQVLERVITDQRESSDLSLEIEKLRDR